jgi:MFS family permease
MSATERPWMGLQRVQKSKSEAKLVLRSTIIVTSAFHDSPQVDRIRAFDFHAKFEAILQSDIRPVASLAALYAIRMLGLFMVLPILATYGLSLEGASPASLGLAIGIYGLTQAVFQIPLGMLSDFIGRKPIIVLGLIVFAIGSALAATSESVEGLIIGRALQGSGAIASTVMALLADLTSEQNRTKAMASIGASIGLSFSLSLVLGPALAGGVGLSGVFWLAGLLAIIGIIIAIFIVPKPRAIHRHRDARALPSLFRAVLSDSELLRLYLGIFVLHAALTALFVALPGRLIAELHIDAAHHWWVYLPVLLISFVLAVPAMLVSERKRMIKQALLSSVLVLGVSQLVFASFGGLWLVLGLFLFFAGFNALEAMLPSLLSKLAPAGAKGTVMGIYSSSQFMGAFVGGALGGWLINEFGLSALYILIFSAVLIWAIAALTMKQPKVLRSVCLSEVEKADCAEIESTLGVEDAMYVAEERIMYLKIDPLVLQPELLKRWQ